MGAKSGMGKTAVFVLACLQQIDTSEKAVKVLVICHTRELAYQIKHEFDRFAKYFTGVNCGVVYGGVPIARQGDDFHNDTASLDRNTRTCSGLGSGQRPQARQIEPVR